MLVFGEVDARENGTIDQGTRATKNDAREEATSNMEATDPCHPRTWKCWTLSPANLEFKKRT